MKTKKIGILGSTGSIGKNVLNVYDNLQREDFPIELVFLTTNENIGELALQISRYKPHSVFVRDSKKAKELKKDFPSFEILSGDDALTELVTRDNYNMLINSFVGIAGLVPTIQAIENNKDIALANKETLVAGGELVVQLLKRHNVSLIPIDSEHSAILQCLIGEELKSIRKIILTASGGPFRNKTPNELKSVTVEEALKHPNWQMGDKITIDSATLMNKGLEVIETQWLFGIDTDSIEVVIHPQSIIHSFVEFIDGSVKAQLGIPDMKIPIQYSLTYPVRVKSNFPVIDFVNLKNLTFEAPDYNTFPCLKLAYQAAKDGGIYPTIMNAANEVAVNLFLKREISFIDIPKIIEECLNSFENKNKFDIFDVLDTDRIVRDFVLKNISNEKWKL
ncbi:MAG: 1-deoxy-D-xylulose-5-phosphate reductoisomerase [Ignavibacteria bacterium]